MTASTVLYLKVQGGKPIDDQLHDQIVELMEIGELVPGQELPSIREVAVELAITPKTVAKAYAKLERDGLIHVNEGTGVFVLTRSPDSTNRQAELHEACRSFLFNLARKGFPADEVLQTIQLLTHGDSGHDEAS